MPNNTVNKTHAHGTLNKHNPTLVGGHRNAREEFSKL